jgi:hypothetical protein
MKKMSVKITVEITQIIALIEDSFISVEITVYITKVNSKKQSTFTQIVKLNKLDIRRISND